MVLGIDLGTTYSVGAYIDRNGDPKVIENAEGSHLTPSVVMLENASRAVVGENAKDSLLLRPGDVIAAVKNEMGKRVVVKEQGERKFTPEMVSSLILRKIAEDAGRSSGRTVDAVVITVPAYFKDSERKATEDAATLAGLSLAGMINEPTAAALCYIHQNHIREETLLIYDLGGGTFDVTILKVDSEGEIRVLSTDGLSHAGGSFFDRDITDYVCREIRERQGIDLKDKEYIDELQDLLVRAEKAKKELSVKETTGIPIRIGKVRENVILSRRDFSEMIRPTVEKTLRKIRSAIEAAGISKENIDRVLLVGGSSRIPFVQEEVSRFLSKDVRADINPDESVAIGAALYGNALAKQGKELHFTDVCSHSIGIVVTDENGKEENERVIYKNSALPVEKERRFRTRIENQKRLSISITEGEYKELTDITMIGNFDISLPTGVPSHSLVLISIGLDRCQLIHLQVKVPDIDFAEEYYMKRIANLEKEEIERYEKEMQKFSVGSEHAGKDFEAADEGTFPSDEAASGTDTLLFGYREILSELDALIGLAGVKEQVKKRIETLEADRRAGEAGAQRKGGSGTLHMLFTGNPGTGKTTVARLLGKLYKMAGILPNGDKLVECNRGNLVGMYQGHTAQNVQNKFKEAEGGILFIDEAYALLQDRGDSFGHEAVDEIVAQMENRRDSVCVILAGYEKDMEEFLRANAGLRSRIRNRVAFQDYSLEELCEIFVRFTEESGMLLGEDAMEPLRSLLEVRSKQPDFGNARGVRNLFDDVREVQNKRLLQMEASGKVPGGKDYDTILAEDLQRILGKSLREEKSLEELLGELNHLTGLAAAKKKVQEMVDAVTVQRLMKERGIEVPREKSTMHLIFKGNAGTGKTTVARLLGEIYVKLGILRKNIFVEVSRADLVANYVGQTATNVIEKLDQADGGILFIDEAYTLINGERDEFGREAVQTLVAELENRRDRLMCIVAGYGKEIDDFLAVNQGLKSRLSNEIYFEDYKEDELVQIFYDILKKRGLQIEEGLQETVRSTIKKEKEKTEDFGNARGVRNLLEQCIRRKDSRLAASLREGKKLDDEEILTIRREDLY